MIVNPPQTNQKDSPPVRMESESSHTFSSQSETPNTIESGTLDESTSRKRTRKDSSKPPTAPQQMSQYWMHCGKGVRKSEDGSIQQIAICNYCKVEIPITYGSTSGLKMLEVALKYRRVFERMTEEWLPFMNYFLEKDEKGKQRIGPPTADDWENAKAFVYFLKKFYDATLELSASKTPTSHLIYQSMVALQIEIERKKNDDSDPTLKNVATSMKLKFDKYWGNWNNMNPLIFIANVLDPRNKLQMIKVSMKKFGGTSTMVQESVDKVKKDLATLWMEYKGINDILNIERENMEIVCDDGDGTSTGGGGLWDELFNDVDAQNQEEQLQEISNEVDKYLTDEIEKRSDQCFNLLEWWRGSETRYPILSFIAKDIFAIPSSTVASESAFSLGKRVVDPFRSSLSHKMVEALVCTNDWLRAEDFSLYKDPTDDDLDLYKEIEEIERNAITNQDRSRA